MRISIDKTKKIGVALSGGVDSMVLLDVLSKMGVSIVAINIEHGIRGSASKKDSEFVKDYCSKKNIPFISKVVDSIAHSKKNNISVELAARELRYDFFDKVLEEKIVDQIALAHHLNDQAETILLRLFRGTGIRGLRGIVDRKGYIHPLIEISKDEICKYAKENNVPFVEDFTNLENEYNRNYIRNSIMPQITKRYPQVLSSFLVLSKNAEEVEDYLCSKIVKAQALSEDVYCLPINIYKKHKAIVKKSIVECIRLMGVEKDIEFSHLENIMQLEHSANNSVLNLPFEIDVIKEYNKLVFIKRKENKIFNQPFDLSRVYEFGNKLYSFAKCEVGIKRGIFDIEKLPLDLRVRMREAKDKFKPFNGPNQLLSDYLTNKKLPKRERDNLLVVAKGQKIYMILGLEIADEIKVENNTNKCMKWLIE